MRTRAALLTGLLAVSLATPAAAAEQAAVDRQVQFTVDGTVTYATVHVPSHPTGRRLPAALLLPGSGPTDRDGDQPPSYTPHTLALIAGVLGEQGVLTLRFDKYFSGQTGAGAYAGDPGRIDLDAFVRQASAAYGVLRDQPEADGHRLYIAGHSEGGMTALLLARSVRPRPAGLALLEPQDERLLDLVTRQVGEQLDGAVKAGQITEAVAEQNKAGVRRVIAEFRAGRPVDTSGLLTGVANLFTEVLFSTGNARFTRTDDEVWPPALALGVPRSTQVLVTSGTADTNVPPDTFGPLTLALAGTRGPGLRVLPGIDHTLHPAGTPENDQVLAPSVLAALRAWAQAAGGVS